MTHPDVPAEQAHVDHAYARIVALRAAAAGRVQEAFGERGGTFQAITERDIWVRNSLGRLEQLQIGREALVFGRIDRAFEGEPPTSEAFHIGRLAVSDIDQEPLVVDWRAPVAEAFYRATGAYPMGLRRRRHFLMDGQHVVDLQDELLGDAGGDESELGLAGSQVLLATLGRARTGRMRDIVATVQREQDEIIRGPLPGVLVVQGGPGTGKTAVALHRAAYLLYTHRFPLEQQGVLVIGPNPTFLRYIEQVLPSLGESGVELSTVSALFGDLKVSGRDGATLAHLKGDARMAGVLARAVRDRERPLRRPLDVPYGLLSLHLSTRASAQIVAAARRRPGSHNSRRRTVETLLWRHLDGELERLHIAHGEGGQKRPDAAELGRQLRRRPDVAEALDRMWPVLTPQELLHDLFGARPLIELASRGLIDADAQRRLYRPRSASLDEVAWSREDIPLLDEARALLGPSSRRPRTDDAGELRTYGHIVVDEAQDLSPMQLLMIARRSLSGSMTVVGDVAQATGPWAPQSWSEVTKHLPANRGSRLLELTVNYRTPAEIMDLAGKVLAAATPATAPPSSVRTSGEPPRFETVAGRADLAGAVVRLLSELLAGQSQGTVAVIAPAALLSEIAEALAVAGHSFEQAGEDVRDAPTSLLAIEDAKGLEFDSVVVVEPARLVREAPAPQGLRALYVAMTRATRHLRLVHAEPLPPALVQS
jgi:DNA helicase IV